MKTELRQVAIRQGALLVPENWKTGVLSKELNETTTVLVANCSKLGYNFSEDLLQVVNTLSPSAKLELFQFLKEVSGVNKNWTPLVKQWNVPTGESVADHIITWFANVFKSNKGTQMPCGHVIPANTFPIERYNGCPFCGTPFEFEKLEHKTGANKLKTLVLWTEEDLKQYYVDLIKSPVALDATQGDSLKTLVNHFGVMEDLEVAMKETLMIIVDALVEQGQPETAGHFFKTPNDILRYLWYKQTGLLQIVEPKTIKSRMINNALNWHPQLDQSEEMRIKSVADLKLKFNRTECKMYATWLNQLTSSTQDLCENMHPKRSMWVRVIRALRLAEYSKKKGFANLFKLMDAFYNENYEVWQGKVNYFKLKTDAEATFALLKQRPGLFARSLFSSMLWFGPDVTIQHFKEVIHLMPSRLIFTLNMYAEIYFDKQASRTVKPLGGVNKRIPANKLLQLYSDEELRRMQILVQDLSLEVIKANLKKVDNVNQTMFIHEGLYNMPIAIGDRSDHLQDLPSALMGTRFKVEGDTVRLFLQWGEGLPAQHLDMDLSCRVAYDNKSEFCSYSQLNILGCKHSGDIQKIPHKVGTAEYIDIDMNALLKNGAKYVSFTCNAYTSGSLAPNLVVGWMNSRFPMKISTKGVAYDPSAVQHQVRIKQSLTKGMVFGVLDVQKSEIIWLEMNFGGQVVQNLSVLAVESLLHKLDAKLKIGDLLKLKAEVQGLSIVCDSENADEVYDLNWVANAAQVSQLFLS